MFGRVEIESDDSFQLFCKLGIVADLKAVDTMRLETVSSPDTAYRRIGYAYLAGHCGPRPMRSIGWVALCRFLDHLGDDLCWNRRSASWPWCILQQARNTKFEKALAPPIHGAWRYLHPLGNIEILIALWRPTVRCDCASQRGPQSFAHEHYVQDPDGSLPSKLLALQLA